MLRAEVVSIQQKSVTLASEGAKVELANDAVIVCPGGLLPKPLLQEVGIQFETKYGTV